MTLALIPARGGSKGIKKKNLAPLAGKPLLYYTLQAAKNANCIDEIVVSSDDNEILTYARSEGVKTLKRPDYLATDTATSDEVLKHCLENFKDFSYFILLQATSPLRTHRHINEAFEKFCQEKSDALFSVSSYDNKVLKAFILNEKGYLKGICNDKYPFMPRQKLPEVFMPNGAIYIGKTELFLKNTSFFQTKTSFYLMNTQESLDIDNLSDLEQANQIVTKEKQ